MKKNFLICLLVVLAFQTSANATSSRKFYLTKNGFYGNQALTACAKGYHMASLFELAVTSDLRYNTTLGYTLGDSGLRPPYEVFGWLRTGLASDVVINCDGWTSTSVKGIMAAPFYDLNAGPTTIIFTMLGDVCTNQNRVWCIED